MRGWLTTAGEVVALGLITAGVYLEFGFGWAFIFGGLALGFISFWIGRDS